MWQSHDARAQMKEERTVAENYAQSHMLLESVANEQVVYVVYLGMLQALLSELSKACLNRSCL